MELGTVVSLVALMASLLTIIAVWRKAGEVEGKILERLDTHQGWLKGHETRLQGIESEYLSTDAPEKACARQPSVLERQIDANDSGLKSLANTLSEMERERHRAREVDNQRWAKIEATLSAVQEYIEGEKRRHG